MELIDVITSKENLNKAYKKVVANKGAGGVDGMKVEELDAYIRENKMKSFSQSEAEPINQSRYEGFIFRKVMER